MNPLQKLIEDTPKNTIGIYKITSPSGKVYIGQSRCVMSRFIAYERIHQSIKDQVRLYSSLKKYGIDNHIFEIIEECLFEELNIKERFWQDYYSVIGKKGLNCLLTKTSELPTVFSEETRKRMRLGQLGKKRDRAVVEKIRLKAIGSKRSDETKLKMRLAQLGKKNSDAHKKATSEGLKKRWALSVHPHTGKKYSEERKNQMRKRMLSSDNPNRGSKRSEKVKLKMSLAQKGEKSVASRKVLNTTTGVIYCSIKEAALQEGIPYSTLKHQFIGRKIYKEELVQLSIVC